MWTEIFLRTSYVAREPPLKNEYKRVTLPSTGKTTENMGIPFYFKTLVNRHHGIVNPLGVSFKCNRLFLDFNSIIHMCASESKTHRSIMDDALAYIEKLISTAKPKDILYVAVDGTCPNAKMVQQRKRRFISAWRRDILGGLWDSNIITPGTAFMREFDELGTAFCMRLEKKYPSLKVKFSGSSEFGEGEHKIFEYIRNNTEPTKFDVIYGLDADLIMLSLLSKKSTTIQLLRERPVFDLPIPGNTEFLVMDIQALSTRIEEEYGSKSVLDYVTLCIALGNDFLPPLSFLKIKNNAVDYIMGIYKDVVTTHQSRLFDDDDGSLNLILLSEIIGQIAKNEDVHFQEAHTVYMGRRAFINRRGDPQAIRAIELDNYPTLNKSGAEIAPEKPGWRARYYQHLFGSTSSDIVNRACKEYMEGLSWVTKYYTGVKHGAPLSWSYTFSYSPTALDLSNYIGSLPEIPKIESPMNDDEFLRIMAQAHAQLLAVLPPQSMSILPEELRSIMTDVKRGCVHMYPIRFKMNTYLKYYLWECTPKLPEIDLRRIAHALTPT